jgi:hypothetical protein
MPNLVGFPIGLSTALGGTRITCLHQVFPGGSGKTFFPGTHNEGNRGHDHKLAESA